MRLQLSQRQQVARRTRVFLTPFGAVTESAPDSTGNNEAPAEAVTMQLKQAPVNRGGATDAEANQFQRPEYLSLNGDQFGSSLPRCFLCDLRVSAVPKRALWLHRHG